MNQFISRLISKSNGDEEAIQPRVIGRFEFQPAPAFHEEADSVSDVSLSTIDGQRPLPTERQSSNPSSHFGAQKETAAALQSIPAANSVVPDRARSAAVRSGESTPEPDSPGGQGLNVQVEHHPARRSEILPSLQDSPAKITLPISPEEAASQPSHVVSKHVLEPVPDRTIHEEVSRVRDDVSRQLMNGELNTIDQTDGGRNSDVSLRTIQERDGTAVWQMENEQNPAVVKVEMLESSRLYEKTLRPGSEPSPRDKSPEPLEGVRMNVIHPRETDRRAREEVKRIRQEEPPAIHISIGRIEIRAVDPQPTVRDKKLEKRSPMLSLDDYLKQQHEVRR